MGDEGLIYNTFSSTQLSVIVERIIAHPRLKTRQLQWGERAWYDTGLMGTLFRCKIGSSQFSMSAAPTWTTPPYYSVVPSQLHCQYIISVCPYVTRDIFLFVYHPTCVSVLSHVLSLSTRHIYVVFCPSYRRHKLWLLVKLLTCFFKTLYMHLFKHLQQMHHPVFQALCILNTYTKP